MKSNKKFFFYILSIIITVADILISKHFTIEFDLLPLNMQTLVILSSILKIITDFIIVFFFIPSAASWSYSVFLASIIIGIFNELFAVTLWVFVLIYELLNIGETKGEVD